MIIFQQDGPFVIDIFRIVKLTKRLGSIFLERIGCWDIYSRKKKKKQPGVWLFW